MTDLPLLCLLLGTLGTTPAQGAAEAGEPAAPETAQVGDATRPGAEETLETPPPEEDRGGFRPVVERVELSHAEVRPGDSFACSIVFRNEGQAAGPADCRAFLHLELPSEPCRSIWVQHDHAPSLPPPLWGPGRTVVDGPHVVRVPAGAEERELAIHVGLYSLGGAQPTLAQAWPGTFSILRDARPTADWQPEPLTSEQLAERRAALRARLVDPARIEGVGWAFELDRASGAFLLRDLVADVVWSSNPANDAWGLVRLRSRADADVEVELEVPRFDRVVAQDNRIEAQAELRMGGEPVGAVLRVLAEPAGENRWLRLRCTVASDGPWEPVSVTALQRALATTDADFGYAVVPRNLGYLLPTDRGLPSERTYTTYDDSSMAMAGAVKEGAALLLAWSHPGVALTTRVTIEDLPLVAGRRTCRLSLRLAEGAEEVELHSLGPGGYVRIATAYREVAARNGWRHTTARDAGAPAPLDGAAMFRPCALNRHQPGTRHNPGEEELVLVHYDFDEVARCAEHWRGALELDRALVLLMGWNRRGYDNGYPDVLPANPECGGDEGLADCARRVRDCGFLFGLHDNYQDAYPDAPSWDEGWIDRDADGAPVPGGLWSGGQSYRVCTSQQPQLAARNWPEMRARYAPDLVYLDTTFAWWLETCESDAHRMTRLDDLRHKGALCRLARANFPLLIGEGGREWGVPLADGFQGLLSYKTSDVPGRIEIPVFPIAFHDRVRSYTAQDDRLGPADAEKVLDHLLYAEMPVYDLPDHAYFEDQPPRGLPLLPEIADFHIASDRLLRITYRWHLLEEMKEDYRVFVHFRHPQSLRPEHVSFQDDHRLAVPDEPWHPGQTIQVGPRGLAIPEDLQGTWDVLIGLTKNGQRQTLEPLPSRQGRHKIGELTRTGGELELTPCTWRDAVRCFARGDRGWTDAFGPTDRFVKNTYEVLSWLNRLTADRPMDGHRFLRADFSAEQTSFGDVRVTVNYAEEPLQVGETLLPQFGFLVESPTFVAFHAARHAGVEYPGGALFTLRSLDGAPLAESREVRVFHGFGPTLVDVAGRFVDVARERVVARD